MKLYGYFRSSAAFRVRIALNLKGLGYEQDFIHLRKGDQRSTEYLRLNPQGLVPMSGNVWVATTASGPATTGAPGTAALGQLESGVLEGSNVDLPTQMVNLIVAQQAYQANVQSINIEQQNFQRLLTIQ